MSKQTIPMIIRLATEADVSFIFNSWLKSHKSSSFAAMDVPSAIYFSEHHKLIERILMRATVLVACSAEDQTHILGYIVAELIDGFPVVHYVYTKHTFRKFGIASYLIKCLDIEPLHPILVSHLTKSFKNLLMNKRLYVYSPYLFYDYSSNNAKISYKMIDNAIVNMAMLERHISMNPKESHERFKTDEESKKVLQEIKDLAKDRFSYEKKASLEEKEGKDETEN